MGQHVHEGGMMRVWMMKVLEVVWLLGVAVIAGGAVALMLSEVVL